MARALLAPEKNCSPESSLSWTTLPSRVLPVLPDSMTLMPLAFLCQPSALREASLNETVLFALPAERMMPKSELLSLVLWVTSDDEVPEREMPAAVNPFTRCPEPVTAL